ncbi:MAG: hypothetical protein AAFQ83_14960 [Bacteroidota bacterium]
MARTLLSLFIMTACLSISAQNFKGGLSLGLNGSQVEERVFSVYILGKIAYSFIFY